MNFREAYRELKESVLGNMWPLELVIYPEEGVLAALQRRLDFEPETERIAAAIEATRKKIQNR